MRFGRTGAHPPASATARSGGADRRVPSRRGSFCELSRTRRPVSTMLQGASQGRHHGSSGRSDGDETPVAHDQRRRLVRRCGPRTPHRCRVLHRTRPIRRMASPLVRTPVGNDGVAAPQCRVSLSPVSPPGSRSSRVAENKTGPGLRVHTPSSCGRLLPCSPTFDRCSPAHFVVEAEMLSSPPPSGGRDAIEPTLDRTVGGLGACTGR